MTDHPALSVRFATEVTEALVSAHEIGVVHRDIKPDNISTVEPRFRAAVLYIAGLGADPYRPESDPVNFLPRIHVPVLMLSGKYDSVFPYEVSQKPFFELIGTPAAEKKRLVVEGGHFLPRPEMVSETLAWLDRYLGPVAR